MKTAKSVLGALSLAAAIAGCSDETSEPAPEAFTNCMRHFTEDNVVGPDAAAAGEICQPFADEGNEAVQRLADKHFGR